jgi:hypothetical protein
MLKLIPDPPRNNISGDCYWDKQKKIVYIYSTSNVMIARLQTGLIRLLVIQGNDLIRVQDNDVQLLYTFWTFFIKTNLLLLKEFQL